MVKIQSIRDELKQRHAELTLINHLQSELLDKQNIGEMVEIVGSGIYKVYNTQIIQICTFDHEKEVENHIYRVEKGEYIHTEPGSITGENKLLMTSKEPLMINKDDVVVSGETVEMTAITKLCVPVIVKDEVTGSICIQNTKEGQYFDNIDLLLISTLADILSVAIQRVEMSQKMLSAQQELKAAKDQLIQQEKLATLGQLTAGIAHEIKNPLNFVNNFSEVSLEMIEEAREEVRRGTEDRGPKIEKGKVIRNEVENREAKREKSPLEGSAEAERRRGVFSSVGKDQQKFSDSDPDPALILEILDDIEANLRKIHEHGSRADNIVTSMLLHSKGGSGNPEPVNLNGLIRDYVNLAFHGTRAGLRPINVEIRYNLDETISEVPLVAGDFSRVILNLCNNAFDAMREKLSENAPKSRDYKKHLEKGKSEKKSPLEDSGGEERRRRVSTSGKNEEAGDRGLETGDTYTPKLTVQTHQKDKTVTIKIEDNGPGIPDEIKDKILQPFFTTKKGTEGTGLGLSITRDIVKMHGGELKIDSRSGNGTTFIITIPINQNIETE